MSYTFTVFPGKLISLRNKYILSQFGMTKYSHIPSLQSQNEEFVIEINYFFGNFYCLSLQV